MEKCFDCGKELTGLKKKFCSKKCKQSSRWRRMTEEVRVKLRAFNRKTYADKREDRLKQKKEYYLLNRDSILNKNSTYKKEHPEVDVRYNKSIKGRYRVYKKGAKKRNHEFNLSLEEFSLFTAQECYYCGEEFGEIGIDRYNNKGGYTVKNSVSCCPVCNRMKSVFKAEEFIDKCNKISKKHTI